MIEFPCTGCSKSLKAADEHAGRRAKCKFCQTTVVVPRPKIEPPKIEPPKEPPKINLQPPLRIELPPEPPRWEETFPKTALVADPLMPCPYCAEPIQRGARKCKHCGEFLDDSRRPAAAQQIVVHNVIQGGGVGSTGGGVAALLSFLIPGLGQMVQGRVGAGVLWLIATMIGYVMLVIPGFILHIICIVDASRGTPQPAITPPTLPPRQLR